MVFYVVKWLSVLDLAFAVGKLITKIKMPAILGWLITGILVFTGIIYSTLAVSQPDLAVIVKGTIAAAAVINEIIAVIAAKKGFELAGEIASKA